MSELATVAAVAELIRAARTALEDSRRLIVGIAGSPGSGKSTIAAQLERELGPRARSLSMDGWHLPQQQLVELRRRDRMGAPDTFDVESFVATLATARQAGHTVLAPAFDRRIEEPVPGGVRIEREVHTLVVEGNYLLLDSGGWERVAPLLDVSLFVAVERGIRIERLIARHERFGKSPADAAAWALGPDESNARSIEPTAARADHVIRLRPG